MDWKGAEDGVGVVGASKPVRRRAEIRTAPSFLAYGPGWTRTTDLTLIRRFTGGHGSREKRART